MNRHRALWLFACILFAGPGLAVAVTWPTSSVLALLLSSAFLVGLATVHFNLLTIDVHAPLPLRLVMSNVANYAFVGGITMVAVVGLATLLGAWVLSVLVLLAGSSPYAVRSYRRRYTRVRGDICDRRTSSAPPPTVADRHTSDAPPPTVTDPLPPVHDVRSLSDAELCQAWQASFHALRATPSPVLQARIADTRGAFLDELARRNAHGLHAWMWSGTEAPEDASAVFSSSTRGSKPSIDWDALMFGRDDP